MLHPAAAALLTSTALIASALAADGPGSSPNLLLNAGAEAGKGDQPSVWSAAVGPAPKGLQMSRALDVARSGKASLWIRYDGPTDSPMAFNWVQPLREVPVGRTIRLRAWLKTADAEAANVCVQCWSKDGRMIGFGSTPVFRGDQDWVESRSEPIPVPEETVTVLVRAAMTGQGAAWFDDLDVSAEAEGLAEAPSRKLSFPGEVVVFKYPETQSVRTPAESTKAGPPRAKGEGPEASSPPVYVKRLDDLPGERRVVADPVKPSSDQDFEVDADLAGVVPGRPIRSLPVEKDVTIISYLPGWCRGDVSWLCLANYGGGVRALIGLPDVPHVDLDDASNRFLLAMYSPRGSGGDRTGTVIASPVEPGWGEQTSWPTRPKSAEGPVSTRRFTPSPGWKLFDVTDAVRAAKGRHIGLMLQFSDEASPADRLESYFESREAKGPDALRRPVLLVVEPKG